MLWDAFVLHTRYRAAPCTALYKQAAGHVPAGPLRAELSSSIRTTAHTQRAASLVHSCSFLGRAWARADGSRAVVADERYLGRRWGSGRTRVLCAPRACTCRCELCATVLPPRLSFAPPHTYSSCSAVAALLPSAMPLCASGQAPAAGLAFPGGDLAADGRSDATGPLQRVPPTADLGARYAVDIVNHRGERLRFRVARGMCLDAVRAPTCSTVARVQCALVPRWPTPSARPHRSRALLLPSFCGCALRHLRFAHAWSGTDVL